MNRHTIEVLTEAEVRNMLEQEVQKAGGQRAWARANNLTAAYVCDVLHGRRQPGASICGALGLEKAVRYVTSYSRALSSST